MTQEQRPTKLKLILDKRRMSQSELYDKIKSSCNSYLGKDVISMIVNGKKKNYEIYTLLKLCVALNVTPNELIEKDDFLARLREALIPEPESPQALHTFLSWKFIVLQASGRSDERPLCQYRLQYCET